MTNTDTPYWPPHDRLDAWHSRQSQQPDTHPAHATHQEDNHATSHATH